eukprot:TRINITY_DN5569_c0_g1_i2.p1 TRINITY_DN5569_c0_g1~~TRINITY_DN5569_c0_g1_i2.p1  ORF type:complete len:205 (+),score=49.64 TRINITY_DN5569_c0_g1_i2:1874-2488(+)
MDRVDVNTCCGTHVDCIAELQMVKFVGMEKNRGLMRVAFLAGNRVSAAVSTWSAREKELNKLLKTNPNEHIDAIKRTSSESSSLQKEKKGLLKELAVFIGRDLAQQPDRLKVLHREDASNEFFVTVVQTTKATQPDALFFFTMGSLKGEGQFWLMGDEAWVNRAGKEVSQLLHSKGGGKGGQYQGKGSLKDYSKVLQFLQSSLE